MKTTRYLGPKACRVELVEWVDSNTRSGWHSLDEARHPQGALRCASVGFLIHEDKERVVLSNSACEQPPPRTDDVCATMEIPKKAILRRTKIRR